MLEVVKDLNLTVRYQKKGRIVNQDLYKNPPVKFQLIRPGTPGSEQFDVSIENKDSYLLKRGKVDAGEFAFNRIYTSEIGSWLISKTPSYNKHLGENIIIHVQDPEMATEGLLSEMLVSPDEQDQNNTQLSIKDKVADRGEAILSQTLRQLNSSSEREKAVESAMEIKLIDQQLLAFGDQVDLLQMELNALSSAERNRELSSTPINYLKVAKENGAALNEINFELEALRGLEAYLKHRDLSTVPPTSASGFSNPTLNGLVRQLIALQLQSKQLLETHLENDPIFDPLRQRAANIKKSMGEGVVSLKSALLKRRAALESSNKRAQEVLHLLPAPERKLVSLKQKQVTYENQYAFLLKRKEAAALNRASNSHVNQLPDTSYKVSINKEKVYTWAFLFGLLIPSFIVAGRSIRSSKNHHKTT